VGVVVEVRSSRWRRALRWYASRSLLDSERFDVRPATPSMQILVVDDDVREPPPAKEREGKKEQSKKHVARAHKKERQSAEDVGIRTDVRCECDEREAEELASRRRRRCIERAHPTVRSSCCASAANTPAAGPACSTLPCRWEDSKLALPRHRIWWVIGEEGGKSRSSRRQSKGASSNMNLQRARASWRLRTWSVSDSPRVDGARIWRARQKKAAARNLAQNGKNVGWWELASDPRNFAPSLRNFVHVRTSNKSCPPLIFALHYNEEIIGHISK
jgi:hypothetical protein